MKNFPELVGNKAKGESQNGYFKKTKHAKFSEKRTFLTPDMHNELILCCSLFTKATLLEPKGDKLYMIVIT